MSKGCMKQNCWSTITVGDKLVCSMVGYIMHPVIDFDFCLGQKLTDELILISCIFYCFLT